MLIAQITDLHIGRTAACAQNDERFAKVVARLVEIQPDLVVATGDLVGDGDAASYFRLKEILALLKAPILPVIGNHDRHVLFAEAFGPELLEDGFVQYATEVDGLRIVVLDTTEPGRHGGAYCERRAAWLSACLDERPSVPTLIALHHPPVRSGIAWMDDDADGPWSQRLAEVMAGSPQVIGLLAGHIHRPLVTSFSGRPLIVAPSSAPQVALDLGPVNGDGAKARVPRIIAEDPGFALHLWTGERLTSHFGVAADHRVVASFDVVSQKMVAG